MDSSRANRYRHFWAAEFEGARAEQLILRTKRSPFAWAQAERWIGQGASPFSQNGDIRFDVSRMPWCREPIEEAVSPEVQVTVLWWAAAMGKSDGVVTNLIGHAIAERPCNIMVLYPNESARDKWSRDVLQRTIDSTPALRHAVVEQKSRDSGNTIEYKRFAGGSIYITAAGSPSNFRGPRAGLVYAGEIDAMPRSVGVEGDPIALLFKRCEGFANAIKIIEGTGTIKGSSRVADWYGRSDQRKWFCPCRACNHLQTLKWRQVRWPAGKPHLARYFCEQCDAEHSDKQRITMVTEGDWAATAEFNGIRGYWINGLNSTLPHTKGHQSGLHQFASEWYAAEHSHNPVAAKTVFINTFLAECVEPEIEPKLDYMPLLQRKREYRKDGQLVIPRDVLVLTIGADVHPNRIEATLCGFTKDEQMHILESETIAGDPESESTWRSLDQWAGRKYKHESGAPIDVSKIALDTGHKPDAVYSYGSPRSRYSAKIMAGKVLLLKGTGTDGAPVINARPRSWRLGSIGTVLGYMVGTNAAKEAIYARLRLTANDGGYPPGYIHFAESLDEEFFRQLTVEQAAAHYERGRRFVRFVNPERQRNEAIDMVCYALGAFRLRRWDFDAISEDLAARANASSITGASDMTVEKERARRHFGLAGRGEDNWVMGGMKW